MFVCWSTEVSCSLEEVEQALRQAPERWLTPLAREADARAQAVLVDVGFGGRGFRVERRVALEVGTPVRLSVKTIVPLAWHAAGPAGLLPVLEGDLEVAPADRDRTRLGLRARYAPPLGALGRVVDRALLHRVADATVRDFVERVGAALCGDHRLLAASRGPGRARP